LNGTILNDTLSTGPRGRVGRQLARRRRRERLAGTLLTMLGIVVLVVAIVAVRHPHTSGTHAGSVTASGTHGATTPASHAPSTHAASTPASHASTTTATAAGRLPLVVLNNTTVSGLARQAAQTFEAGGWTVTSYGNYQNDIISSCAYYDPTYPGAQAAAEALRAQFPAIKRDVPKFAGLPAGPIVVVLTPDYVSQ
jgi:hypothetical protein